MPRARRETNVIKTQAEQEPIPIDRNSPEYQDKLAGLNAMLHSNQTLNEVEFEESEELEGTSDIPTNINNSDNADVLNNMVNASVKVDKKTANLALEKAIAGACGALLVIGSRKLFGVGNEMVEAEAMSIVAPSTRIVSRRVDKYVSKVVFPFPKMDKKDKEDVEEIVTTVGLYMFRLVMTGVAKILAFNEQSKQKKQGNMQPSVNPEQFNPLKQQSKPRYIQRLDTMNEQAGNTPINPGMSQQMQDSLRLAKMQQDALMQGMGDTIPESDMLQGPLAMISADMGLEG